MSQKVSEPIQRIVRVPMVARGFYGRQWLVVEPTLKPLDELFHAVGSLLDNTGQRLAFEVGVVHRDGDT